VKNFSKIHKTTPLSPNFNKSLKMPPKPKGPMKAKSAAPTRTRLLRTGKATTEKKAAEPVQKYAINPDKVVKMKKKKVAPKKTSCSAPKKPLCSKGGKSSRVKETRRTKEEISPRPTQAKSPGRPATSSYVGPPYPWPS
jgi:hypothetical protein